MTQQEQRPTESLPFLQRIANLRAALRLQPPAVNPNLLPLAVGQLCEEFGVLMEYSKDLEAHINKQENDIKELQKQVAVLTRPRTPATVLDLVGRLSGQPVDGNA